MADYEVVKSGSTGNVPGDVPVTAALTAYALFGVAAAVALISAGGFVVAAPLPTDPASMPRSPTAQASTGLERACMMPRSAG